MSEQSPNDQLRAVERAIGEIRHADGARRAELRVELLGRKAGRLTHILRGLSSLPPDERRVVGLRANELKREIESALESGVASPKPLMQAVDLTMPGRSAWRGAIHPVTAVVDEICEIFRDIGFTRVSGPEAETQEYNFTKLNISLDHPAADMQDTMFLSPGMVMRTHTSPVQARTMEQYEPPIRIVVPGQVYRRDAFDASHAPVFEQLEGLVVDEGVSFVDFKAAIDFFVKRFFSKTTAVRFRPSFFPFTEPSAEVDVEWGDGWLEIMGAGMVHPAVLENCGIDSERYTGYAFGMGPHRITMLRHGIPDIRLLFQNDMRFLGQFVE